jgi:putative transposase
MGGAYGNGTTESGLGFNSANSWKAWLVRHPLPAGLVTRAKIILLSASGKTNLQIARQLELTNATVGKWRRRFLHYEVAGLHDELRPGRPRPISDERVAQLVRKTLETKPKGTHWSIRQIATETRVSKSTVHRIWQAFGLEPHRQKHFKLSTDPFFVEKVRDIVGLYLHPRGKCSGFVRG